MIGDNPEFADLIYDWIKERHPSASKSYRNNVEIFIHGRLVCEVYGSFLVLPRYGDVLRPTDPHLFEHLSMACGMIYDY